MFCNRTEAYGRYGLSKGHGWWFSLQITELLPTYQTGPTDSAFYIFAVPASILDTPVRGTETRDLRGLDEDSQRRAYPNVHLTSLFHPLIFHLIHHIHTTHHHLQQTNAMNKALHCAILLTLSLPCFNLPVAHAIWPLIGAPAALSDDEQCTTPGSCGANAAMNDEVQY